MGRCNRGRGVFRVRRLVWADDVVGCMHSLSEKKVESGDPIGGLFAEGEAGGGGEGEGDTV